MQVVLSIKKKEYETRNEINKEHGQGGSNIKLVAWLE